MPTISLAILLGVLLLTLPLRVGSAGLEVAAHQAAVLKVDGDVRVQTGSRPWSHLTEGSMLYAGDRIKTGSNGFLAIILSDQTVLKVADNTELRLVDLRATEDANLIRRFQVSVGRVWSDVTPMTRPGSVFEVEGPQATAAVKGTSFEVDASGQQTEVRVWEGAVEARNPDGRFLVGADSKRFAHDRVNFGVSKGPNLSRLQRNRPDAWQKWNLENRQQILRTRRAGKLDREGLQRFRGRFLQGPPLQARRRQSGRQQVGTARSQRGRKAAPAKQRPRRQRR